MATAALKRTVTWTSSPFDACTMKVTASPLPAPPGATLQQVSFHRGGSGPPWRGASFGKTSCANRSSDQHRKVQFVEIDDHHARETTSMESPFRKSSSAVFPATMAARWERKPPSHIRTPMGFRLRRISQHQDSLPVPFRKIV